MKSQQKLPDSDPNSASNPWFDILRGCHKSAQEVKKAQEAYVEDRHQNLYDYLIFYLKVTRPAELMVNIMIYLLLLCQQGSLFSNTGSYFFSEGYLCAEFLLQKGF